MAPFTRLLFVASIFAVATEMRADDPPPAEPLSAPTKVEVEPPAEAVDVLPMLPYERVNRYGIWQYYAVDRQGHFRARVIMSPYGNYYLHNGAPYPFAANRSLNFMPYVND